MTLAVSGRQTRGQEKGKEEKVTPGNNEKLIQQVGFL
jgi:hypothetical protein